MDNKDTQSKPSTTNLEQLGQVLPVTIEEELKTSYLDYAMSVIIGRALPDARDGFKPVHRRVLYSMNVDGQTPDKSHTKSAEIVGKVMGMYHPHGDSAIYNTLVRMAQDFSLRYTLVDGQGNFGGRGDESPAAMRYTEARMTHLAVELLRDIDKETVDFVPNYSNKLKEPVVLPARIPNLLINGSSGIAVGMATNIPPHNLTEVIKGTLAYIDNPEISIIDLMEYITGPDFPTGCTICNLAGLRKAYLTGRGSITMRALYDIREEGKSKIICIREIPYQVSYTRIIEKINELVTSKKISGIVEVLNLTKKDINIEIKVRQDVDPHVIMNQLYQMTQLQENFGINMVALHEGRPRLFNLKELIEIFVSHRREVITRRCVFDLNKSKQRVHILESLSVALANIEEIIRIIRSSANRKEASESLMNTGWSYDTLKDILASISKDASISRPDDLDSELGINGDKYYFSTLQVNAILDMPLARLTNLEKNKIEEEYFSLVENIVYLLDILNSPAKLTEVMKNELSDILERYSRKSNNYDARLSVMSTSDLTIEDEDLITKEEVVVTLSNDNYIKYQQLGEYQSQRRGGMGKQAAKMKDDDYIKEFLIANTHDNLLCFTNTGRVFKIKVYKLPLSSRIGKGRPINNFIDLLDHETITNIIVSPEIDENNLDKFLVFATVKGRIKKTKLNLYKNASKRGLKAIRLLEKGVVEDLNDENEVIEDDNLLEEQNYNNIDDFLSSVSYIHNDDVVYLFSLKGRCLAFNASKLRAQSRVASGVKGIKVNEDDAVVALLTPKTQDNILTVTENGIGKRTNIEDLAVKLNRNGRGNIAQRINEKTGSLVDVIQVNDNDHVMLITDGGKVIRIAASAVSTLSRTAAGVKLINLTKGEKVVRVSRVVDGALEDDGEEIVQIDGTIVEDNSPVIDDTDE